MEKWLLLRLYFLILTPVIVKKTWADYIFIPDPIYGFTVESKTGTEYRLGIIIII